MCFRWCYGPWGGERLVALSVDMLASRAWELLGGSMDKHKMG